MDKSWYKIKYIRKKRKIRRIVTYSDNSTEIKNKHIGIKDFLEKNIYMSKFTKAYKKDSSIFKNAKAHMYNDVFIKLDIKDFFQNIDHKILLEILFFELNKSLNTNKYSKKQLLSLIELCSVSERGLPLGLVTSPILANIYLKEFDNLLYGNLKKFGLNNIIYTRYADDLTISFKKSSHINIVNEKKNIELLVSRLLKKNRLKLNYSKSKMIDFEISNHVRITGLNIVKDTNNFRRITVGRKRINDLFHQSMKLHLKLKEYSLTDSDKLEIQRIRGMESFIYSIEKKGYEYVFSNNMKESIYNEGFRNLSELLDALVARLD